MSVLAGDPGSVPSKLAGVGAFELKTIVYLCCPATGTVPSRLIMGRVLLISILTLVKSTGVGVGLAVGEGLTDGLGLGLGLGLGVGEGLPGGFSTLLVLVS